MGLIKKMLKIGAGVGMIIAGLPVSSEALAIGGGVTFKIYKDKLYDAIEGESDTKTICVLNEKYENMLQDLDENSIDFGNVQLKFSPIGELQGKAKYEQMYDNVTAVFDGKKMRISKEEFVDFMLNHGDEVISYVKSDEFKKRLDNINNYLKMWRDCADDEPRDYFNESSKGRVLSTFRTEIELDNMAWEHDPDDIRYSRDVCTAGICIICASLGLFSFGIMFGIVSVAGGCDGDGMFNVLKYLCTPFLSIMAGSWLGDQLDL